MVGDILEPTHLLFVLVVALLVLGPKRLPEVGRTLGSGIRDFRQALSGEPRDPPQRQEFDQSTTTATDLEHEPSAVDSNWPESAVGPISFDEPVTAASAEPAHETAVDLDAADSTDPAEVDDDTGADRSETGTASDVIAAAPEPSASVEAELTSDEHDFAQHGAESSGAPKPQADSGN